MDDGRTFTDRLAFLRAGDVVLADHLLRAAQLAHDDPASCAVALRCFAEHLVRQHLAAGTKRSKKALFEILIDLQQAGALPTGILNDLDSLRQVGNLGAHPEQQHQALGNMEEELRRGWRLAEWFHAWLGGRPEDVPSFEPPTPADGNSIYREAFLGGSDGRGDPVAKFHVAKAIRLQDEQRLKEARMGGQLYIRLRTNEVRDLLRGVICDVPAARTELATLRLQKHEVTDDDRKEALELLTWAVEGDDPDGLFYLGAFYLQGDHGLGVDIGKAVGLLERAVGHEHPGAFNALAMLYRDGRGVEADPVLARRYAERSAEAGFPIGQHQLAGFLLEGFGGDADREAGLLWLRRAVRQDWPEAKFHLAFLILEGYVEAGPGENPEALLEKACQERSVNALLWRADRELKKPDDHADFQRIFNDLIAAGECSDSPPGAVTQEKLREAYLRLDRYLRRLPTSSLRRPDLSFLWFQFASDGTRKYTKDELVDLVTPFGREQNGGPNDADWQLNMIRAQSGPGVSEAEIRRRMAYLQAAKSAGGPALSKQEPAEIQRVGRNEPCPCGNGKKYKKCHGR